jgi:8-oxo-dGTP pyrophosphatase MutT (NUDIX family)
MSEQIFQVSVKALIQNNSGHILMVHLPAMGGNDAHWDLPGGRMDKENLLETLRRELIEEIGVPYIHKPDQLMTFLTHIKISVGSERLPLIYVVYKTDIAEDTVVKLDPKSVEDKYGWFEPKEAVELMAYKFSKEFCNLISNI